MTNEELCKALRNAKVTQDFRTTLEDEAADRIEALVKEREAHHANPADFRYWEGRYRDEAARAEAAEALIADCADYLKEGETPRQRMDRDHKDVLALMDLLAKEKMRREAAEAALKDVMVDVSSMRDILNRNLVQKDGPNTLDIGTGETFTGPVVDWAHKLIEAQIDWFNRLISKHGSQK